MKVLKKLFVILFVFAFLLHRLPPPLLVFAPRKTLSGRARLPSGHSHSNTPESKSKYSAIQKLSVIKL